MPKHVLVAVILYSFLVSSTSAAQDKNCRRWQFSLRSFLVATGVISLAAIWIGNEKRRRDEFNEWTAILRKRPQSGPTKEYTNFLVKDRAVQALQEEEVFRVLRNIVEANPEFSKEAKAKGIKLDYLEKRSKEYRRRLHQIELEFKKHKSTNLYQADKNWLQYSFFDDAKDLAQVSRWIFGERVENPDIEMELARLQAIERAKFALPLNTGAVNQHLYLRAGLWCKANGIPLKDFLREVRAGLTEEELKKAELFFDEAFHPEVERFSLENDFRGKGKDVEQGLNFEKYMQRMKNRIEEKNKAN